MDPKYKQKLSKKELEESEKFRKSLTEKYGFIPTSIMKIPVRDKELDALVEDTLAAGSYMEHGMSVRSGALSQTPVLMTDFCIRFWSKQGDTVFDPFFERVPQLIIANHRGRHAIGYDISHKFFVHNVEKITRRIGNSLMPSENKVTLSTEQEFQSVLNGLRFEMYCKDSRKTHLENSSVDFVISSPPYWDIEYYGPELEQLGTGLAPGSYDLFLEELGKVYSECLRVLKPGKFMVIEIQDFRKEGEFYPYSSDVISLCRRIGFKIHDILIFYYGHLSAIFAVDLERDKRSAKVHEYWLVFRKPGFKREIPEELQRKKSLVEKEDEGLEQFIKTR